ncbi:MAG: DNA circularization N-terminal domain-containing protein [Methylobacterium sp.]|nr:DNA circularization N-terminal domain-containing protein [Methylobacterium sp.]
MTYDQLSLRRASFNGIPFWVLTGDAEAGHRVSTTLIPGGAHINESFGPAARKYEVEAYCVGANAYSADALLAAAENLHFGALILPDQPAATVRLTKARRRFDRDKLGYLVVSLEAVAEPAALVAGLSAFAFDQRIYALAGAAVPLAAALASGFATPLPAAQEAASDAAASVAADLSAVATLGRLEPTAAAKVAAALDLALAALPSLQAQPEIFGRALADAAIVLGDESEPSRLAESLRLLGAPQAVAGVENVSQVGRAIAAIDANAPRMIGALRALAMGQSQARAEWVDRPAAEAARALASAVFEDALSRLGREGLPLHRALSQLRGVVTERATARAASLAPLAQVSAMRRLPSLVWSWNLYGSAGRAHELVARSRATHPGFLPEQFEALAS